MKLQFFILSIFIFGCSMESDNKNENKKMEKVEILNSQGNVILKTQTFENKIEGSCKWFNSGGELIAKGEFKNGTPYNGTFLDWSLFFEQEKISYEPESYCKDWVSLFESSFLSQKADYSVVVVYYQNGEKINKN